MEEKKIKISLGTAICLFLIFILIIALICMYYFGIYKNKENNTVNEIQTKEENSEIQNTTISSKNQAKKYIIQPDKNILDEPYFEINEYGDEYIVFNNDGTFKAYIGWGNNIEGTYETKNDTINCTANIFSGEYGPDQKINASISFKTIDDSTIEVVKADKSCKIKIVDIINNTLTDEEKEYSLSPFVKGIKFNLLTSREEIIDMVKELNDKTEKKHVIHELAVSKIEKKSDKILISAFYNKPIEITEEEYQKIKENKDFEEIIGFMGKYHATSDKFNGSGYGFITIPSQDIGVGEDEYQIVKTDTGYSFIYPVGPGYPFTMRESTCYFYLDENDRIYTPATDEILLKEYIGDLREKSVEGKTIIVKYEDNKLYLWESAK